MLRLIIVGLLLSANVFGQDSFKISLDIGKIENLTYKISKIIDSRRDKNSIGFVRNGHASKGEIVVFNTPGLEEVNNLLNRSGLIDENGIVLRVNRIYFSEIKRAISKTSRVEVSINVLIQGPDDLYYYITSVSGYDESVGSAEFPINHQALLVSALQKALEKFIFNESAMVSPTGYTYDELVQGLEINHNQEYPILSANSYNDGFYVTFEEFLNNQPSIVGDCDLKFENSIVIKCNNSEETEISLFGFAKENQLYIIYHQQIFQLYKENNTFYFKGPTKFSKSSSDSGWMLFGLAGTFATMNMRSYHLIYKINMEDGSVKSVTGF